MTKRASCFGKGNVGLTAYERRRRRRERRRRGKGRRRRRNKRIRKKDIAYAVVCLEPLVRCLRRLLQSEGNV
jgi:hypothetical protein